MAGLRNVNKLRRYEAKCIKPSEIIYVGRVLLNEFKIVQCNHDHAF